MPPSLGRDFVIDIFQQIITKKNKSKFETLTKFMLCGKAPFKMVSNHFSSAECEKIWGDQYHFEIKKSNNASEKYMFDINPKSAPFLMILRSSFQCLVIVDFPINKKCVELFLTKRKSCIFNIHGKISLLASCNELKFTNLSFNNAFNKYSSKHFFPYIEILKITGTFNNFKQHGRKAFKDFIFHSFPNLKKVDIIFNKTSSCSKINIDDINESVNEFKLDRYQSPPNFRGTIKFYVELLNSKDFKFVLTQLKKPFSRFHFANGIETVEKNIYESDDLNIYFEFE